MDSSIDCSEHFASDGKLARAIEGFYPREAQIDMAQAIANAFAEQSKLMVEAGTGTGKTFAYIVPALLSDKKTLISTGTKSLQDQLFQRDLPLIQHALGIPKRVALLKGRANYLCKYRIENYPIDTHFYAREVVADYTRIVETLPQLTNGDINEFSDIAADADVWPMVTSTEHNCLGQQCPLYEDCFLVKARREALEADIVIVNHHLFFADLVLKSASVGELLPTMDAFIFDEAHQLPDIATHFFGEKFTQRQAHDCLHDVSEEVKRLGGVHQDLVDLGYEVKQSLRTFRDALGRSLGRFAWQDTARNNALNDASQQVSEALQTFSEHLLAHSAHSRALEKLAERADQLLMNFNRVIDYNDKDAIHWYEQFVGSFALHRTPLNIAESLGRHINQSNKPWIFTSATLTVNQSFDHCLQEMGLDHIECLSLQSPFDYQKQALFYIPHGMPDPKHRDYLTQFIEATAPVIQAMQGRTLCLFTSHAALKSAAEMFRQRLPFPVFAQNEAPNATLLSQFKDTPNALLLGTQSFWEGIDIKGDDLRCVIIDKLPFASPHDPIMRARLQAIKSGGSDPFYAYSLPKAVIALKQGVGRLIRSEDDTGVLMVCDPRLLGRAYGATFLQSLPNMRRSKSLQDVVDFARHEHTRSRNSQQQLLGSPANVD